MGMTFALQILFLCFAFSALSADEINVLGITGSTREGSYNKKLLVEAANLAKEQGANVTLVSLKDFPMPFYDGDEEARAGMPPAAKRLRKLMIDSQVILIASPEYNGSVSAVLKNALDWASRGEAGNASQSAFAGKKILIMSASPGKSGGVRGLQHLKTVIENAGGKTDADQIVVPYADKAFDESGKLKDAQLRTTLQRWMSTNLNANTTVNSRS